MNEHEIQAISDRMMVWFTSSLLSSNTILFQKLEQLAAEYDAGPLTVGEFDKIMLESDKIQAELFRRLITELRGG